MLSGVLLARLTILLAAALLTLRPMASAAIEPSGAAATREIRFIYLVPRDRPVSRRYADAMSAAARHVQSWLGQALHGRTFRLADPAVRIVQSDKPARWFSAIDRHSGDAAFYLNTLDELTRLGVAGLNDPQARFMVYVDADHACGQSGAGTSGLAVVSANDLRGLGGERILPACETPNGAEIAGRCRWIGGMGHELLHTLGLAHPDRSPACQTARCRSEALMMNGYIRYPNATLLDEEAAALSRSPFMQDRVTGHPGDCAVP